MNLSGLEIYIHAEGYPAREMKHGSDALIDENLPGSGAGHLRPQPSRIGAALGKDKVQHQGNQGTLGQSHRCRDRG